MWGKVRVSKGSLELITTAQRRVSLPNEINEQSSCQNCIAHIRFELWREPQNSWNAIH